MQRRGGGGGGDMGGGGRGADPGRFDSAARSQAVAIAAVSTAFLDAEVRGDRRAREWLDHQAAPWLRGLAAWQQR
jgi:hypothetical protein